MINDDLGPGVAELLDAGTVNVDPSSLGTVNPARLAGRIENLTVEPESRARVVVDHKSGTIVVGEDVRIFPAEGGRAGIERRVRVLGRELTLLATGTVVADDGQLLIEPETVDLGGPELLDSAVSALARGLVTIRQDVAGVPDGMSLTGVEVTDAGFAAALTGTDVTVGR